MLAGFSKLKTIARMECKENETKFSGMNEEKTVIFHFISNAIFPEIKSDSGIDTKAGKLLNEFLCHTDFKSCQFVTTNQQDFFRVVTEKNQLTLPLVRNHLLPNLAKFMGTNWNFKFFTPAGELSKRIKQWKPIKPYEWYFQCVLEKSKVLFLFGGLSGVNSLRLSTHVGDVVGRVIGKPNGELYWPIDVIENIAAICIKHETLFSVSYDGALQITCKANYGSWWFILPARLK
ncbi:hypothetical protein BEN30_11330 [Magnetovibrio blakemorei]|uniref:Uncharacterized protein n=2 Tax=Magnetovibrio blakemorei TaxID=28181 RepID=A0A1E5Q772_9PROT|nr:hypothetical protein BEN30_11330 [Magnetovibrio blakemorei]